MSSLNRISSRVKAGVVAALLAGVGGCDGKTLPVSTTTATAEDAARPQDEQSPTVTLADSSSLDNPQNIPAFDAGSKKPSTRFFFSSARIAQAGPAYPRDSMVAGIQNTSLYDNGTLVASWVSDAPILEIPLYAQNGTLRFVVDGQEIINAHQHKSSTPFEMPQNDGAIKTISINWTKVGGRRLRHYRAEVGGFFAGARVAAGDVFRAEEKPRELRVAFVGDSYFEGAGADSPWDSMVTICARELGVEPILLGSGGTGYISTPYEKRFPFIGRLSDLKELSPAPQMIVVAGGINDNVPEPALATAAAAYFNLLKTTFPKSKIVVIGPWSPLGRYPASRADLIKTTAQASGLSFIDVRDWLPATEPAYIGDDHTHPTPAGHKYIGERLAQQLKPLLPPQN